MLPPFPLPAGHAFGPGWLSDLRFHDGSNVRDSIWLRQWQARYRERLKRWSFEPSGRYDKATQQAVLDVQRLAGQPPTGMLDGDAWTAVEVVERPKPPPPPEVPKSTGGKPIKRAKRKGKSTFTTYWRRYSNRKVIYNCEGAPPWYPGKPFGPNEQGWHVKRLQQLLGLKPTGNFNMDVQRKVRGLQQLHGLPVSGICDIRVACLVDPDNVPQPEPA